MHYHYLNILHAGWPGGMILGGLLSIALHDYVSWEVLMSFFLIPVLIYGEMMRRQEFPQSEASAAGVSFKEMLLQFASPVLLFLIFLLYFLFPVKFMVTILFGSVPLFIVSSTTPFGGLIPRSFHVSSRFAEGNPPKYVSSSGVISAASKLPTKKKVKSMASEKRS